jgi:hypothetical protein
MMDTKSNELLKCARDTSDPAYQRHLASTASSFLLRARHLSPSSGEEGLCEIALNLMWEQRENIEGAFRASQEVERILVVYN